jgi:hypothetical protein
MVSLGNLIAVARAQILESVRTSMHTAGTVLLFVACVAVTACDQKLSTLGGPTPNLEPTFASVQSQIFETTDVAGRQACVSCHTNVGRNPSGGLNLAHPVAYDSIVNVASARKAGAIRVIPGDPENSYLVQKLEGRTGIVGVRMPQSGPPYLTDGQILILKRWIALGAPRN